MQNQYIQHGNATPSVNLKFIVPSTGLSCTTLTNATGGLTLAYSRPGAANVNIALAAQTVTGAWTSGGFVHRGDGVYRLDLPAAAVLTGVIQLTLLAALLPADVALVAIVVALGPDDLGVAAPTQAGIASASATAVDAVLADNFAAIATGTPPSAAAVTTAVLAGLAGAEGATARTNIANAVDSVLADNFAGIATGTPPSAAAVSTQVMADLAGAGGAAARTAIGVAVDSAVADNFAAIGSAAPSAATVAAQVMAYLAGSEGAAARSAIGTQVDSVVADNFAAIPAAVDSVTADNFAAVLSAVAGIATGATVTDILAGLAGISGVAARREIAEACTLTMMGGADLRFDDAAGGANLVVVRKSNSVTVATIPLRRGDRTQAIVGNG